MFQGASAVWYMGRAIDACGRLRAVLPLLTVM